MRYRDDCERIQRVLADKGISVTLAEAETLWDEVSDASAAGWLALPVEDEDLVLTINSAAIGIVRTKISVSREATLLRLAGEYRETMDIDVLHSWARDVVSAIREA